jgi:hypothetical protein
MRRRVLIVVLSVLALAVILLPAAPAQASVGLCNSNAQYGTIIDSATPAGSSTTRYLYGKACMLWDSNSTKTSVKLTCLTENNDLCDFRANVTTNHNDLYYLNGDFGFTAAANTFQMPGPGYVHGSLSWNGSDVAQGTQGLQAPFPCNHVMQNNNNGIYWRLGADGVLRSAGSMYSQRGFVCQV